MLRFFTILILLCFASNANAQTYVPFPTSTDTAVWLEYYVNISNPNVSYYEINTYGDTILDGLIYTKIYKAYDNVYPGNYYAAIREENKIIYLRDYVDSYDPINSDTILFDFNAQVGDTVNWYGELFPNPVVQSIDSVEVNGIFRKRFNLDVTQIIEGIGSNRGFIPFYGIAEEDKSTYCYHLNSDLIWKEDGLSDCYAPTKQIQQTDNISINPNPTSDFLNIDFETNEQRELQVFNQLGQLVLSETSNDANLVLSLEHLPKGFYVLAIQTEKGTFTKKIIKE
jgi:hypothetical protein